MIFSRQNHSDFLNRYFKSYLILPIYNSQLAGLLLLGSNREDHFGQQEFDFAAAFVHQISPIINSLKLKE